MMPRKAVRIETFCPLLASIFTLANTFENYSYHKGF